MGQTNIEWATHTINFYDWACRAMSPGCDNCYARALAQRHGKNFDKAPEWRENAVKEWMTVPSGSVVFINSMSDTWHEDVPIDVIQRLYGHLAARPDVTALVLTKRIGRWRKHAADVPVLPNVWAGTSIESPDYAFRARLLTDVPAAGRFVSAEPLLHDISAAPALTAAIVDHRIHWVIVGAESGPNRRVFNTDWARNLRDLCDQNSAAFMFKQGSHFKPGQERVLDGRTYDGVPDFALHAGQSDPEPTSTTQMRLFS